MFQQQLDGTPQIGGPALSVVVPCYNEVGNLTELHRRVTAVADRVVGESYELILVNDGSRDKTWDAISTLAASDYSVVGVNLARNHGHQLALTAGLAIARGRRVFVLDADLQDPPELLADMMRLMDDGNDVVFGKRTSREGETIFKRATANIFYRVLSRMVDVEIPRDTGDFRLMSRRVVDALDAMPERHRFIRGMVAWIGFRQTAVEYRREARFAGETNYPLRKMIALALDAITSFSTLPLRMASHLGFALGLAGLVGLGAVTVAWLFGYTIEGWASLAVLILLMGSIQMLMLGVLGEYLGRMYMQNKQRPLYMIDEILKMDRRELSEPAIRAMQHQLRTAIDG